MKNILIGNRIPKDYFVTTGVGESDITIHAGSYHLALKNAGIEMCNIMTYSSILPKIANEVEYTKIDHGSVVETIMAVSNSNKGERSTAGIIYGWLYDKKTNEKYGGLVCEHNGCYEIEQINGLLNQSLNELYINGFSEQYNLTDIKIHTESIIPTKQYGTAIVAICFLNYQIPII